MADSMTRYVSKVEPEGWLEVRPATGVNISLPYGLKLDLIETKGGREYFEILEGPYKGVKASVRQKALGQSYLLAKLGHSPGGLVQFDRKSQSLYFGGRGPFNAFSGGGFQGFTPVSQGSHQLSIPPYPARATRQAYGRWTRYHRTWFRIGVDINGSRFLHPGAISEGCVTVRQFLYDPNTGTPPPGFQDLPELAKQHPGAIGLPYPKSRAPIIGWDVIYEYLILCRANDQSVGTLVVT